MTLMCSKVPSWEGGGGMNFTHNLNDGLAGGGGGVGSDWLGLGLGDQKCL